MSILYLVPTPLGDPDDITLRALRILREVSAIAGFNESATQALMDHYGITIPIISYKIALAALDVGDVALVSVWGLPSLEQGTPGIGDGAHEIVVEALARGIRVEALPGASVEIMALVLSGLPTEAFVYIGTLPDDLSVYTHEHETMIFTTEDAIPALKRLIDTFGDRQVCVTARLTQPDEIAYRGLLSDASVYMHEWMISDAVILVVEGAAEEIAAVWDETQVQLALRERLASGEPLKLAAKAVAAAAGWDRRAVYALGVEMKKIQ